MISLLYTQDVQPLFLSLISNLFFTDYPSIITNFSSWLLLFSFRLIFYLYSSAQSNLQTIHSQQIDVLSLVLRLTCCLQFSNWLTTFTPRLIRYNHLVLKLSSHIHCILRRTCIIIIFQNQRLLFLISTFPYIFFLRLQNLRWVCKLSYPLQTDWSFSDWSATLTLQNILTW